MVQMLEEEDHAVFHVQTQVLAQALKSQVAFCWRAPCFQEESELIQCQRGSR